MLKILVYANMKGIYSSRDVEKACIRDINFIWLLNGEKAPNYHEIARFRSKRLSECVDDLFYQFVKELSDIGEIKFEHLFVDGTKIEANANKYSFVWKKSINKYEARLLEKMDKNIGVAYQDVTADAGYESEENYTYFEDKGQTCYIKPQNYERSKTKKFKSNMALMENMAYDSEKDEYTCPSGRKLKAVYTGIRKSKSGFESEITYYECESCENCSYKKGCTRSKYNRKMQVSKKFISQRQKSLENITSPLGILLRTNRSIQSEGAFGAIKENYKFRQFLLRGNRKVLTEITLLAIAYNINKYHHKIQDNRTGTQLHGKLSA